MNDDGLFYDYLDELLDPEQASEAEAAIRLDPSRFAAIARRRAILYRPFAVPAPRTRRRALPYVAAFLLGAVAPLLFLPLSPKPPHPQPEPARLEVMNRRLR